MENSPPNDLTRYHTNFGLIRQTADQIAKDFGEFGEEVFFSGNPQTAYAELYGQIESVVTRLSENDHSRLIAMLYCIDVDEQQVHQRMAEEPDVKLTEVVTELIIERELRKVVMRSRFSGK